VQEDPWVEPASTEYSADSDTLTYDFLSESTPEVAQAPPAEADLPVLEEEAAAAGTAAAPVGAAAGTAAAGSAAGSSAAPPESGPLFWVQIFASSNQQSAEAVANEAEGKLDERVRVLFMDPYYKVLAGGFSQREQAVELRRAVVGMGYADAWIFEY
jgi:septal ring-binding cell division protein DamX